ncbi:MAG: AraC family transcriptional regulator of arabinose operon [Oceanicoccus sp.]|jgi:AraC family transcriptional regulator of arabinose operon
MLVQCCITLLEVYTLSQPSQWPLTFDAVRSITPQFIVNELAANPLSSDCYPIAMGYYPRANGHSIHRLQHDDNLLLYCTDGSGEIETDDFSGVLKKGDVLLLPEGYRHRYQASNRTPWTVYWFHFKGASCRQLLQNVGYDPEQPVMSIGFQLQLIADFKRLLAVRHTGFNVAAYFHCAAVIRQILCFLALEVKTLNSSKKHNFSLDEIQRFMQERINGDLNLETLAAGFNLSKYHFSNKYKQLTGYPPIKHFIHMKMERACYLLDSSSASVTLISHQLGYDDSLYFSRLFRKTVGLSPSKYRLHGRG